MAHYNTININEIKPHYLYKSYGVYGQEIITINKMRLHKGAINNSGYRLTAIRYNGNTIHYLYHRFIYECNHGVIPDGYVVDHIDNNKMNNNIENLQVITQCQNLKKNYIQKSRVAIPVRAICLETGFIQDFKSMTFAGKILNINRRSIQFVCDGITNTSISKSTGLHYYFHYL